MSQRLYYDEDVGRRTLTIVDFRNLRGAALLDAFERFGAHVATRPHGSMLVLTLAHGIEYSPSSMKAGIQLARRNGPHTRKSAMVGLDHLSGLVNIVNRLSGRSIRAFDEEDAAREWLLKDD